jgi:protein-S-isoprenylcysteine O-methyltransferase Ste14
MMRTIDYCAIGIQVSWMLIELIIFIKMRSPKGTSKSKDFTVVYLLTYISIYIGINVGISIKSSNILGLYSDSFLFPLIGIFVIILGISIRLTAINSLKTAFTVNLAISENQKLIQNGLYKKIRHPAYLGGLLSIWGIGICYGNIISVVLVGLPYTVFILFRIKKEEKMLIEKYSNEYLEMQKRTKKLIPFIY